MSNVPRHLAVILDGNRRWAKEKGLPGNMGHVEGAKRIEEMCELVWNAGIEYFTVYAFSTENWSRPENEVAALMKILRDYMKNCIKRAAKNNMKVRVIGDKKGLAPDIQKSIEELEEASGGNTGLKFTIALNYGSRDELTRAFKKLGGKIEKGELGAADISQDMISEELDTAGYPDPDLLVRTSGEQRISNFLLWQCAYSEFYFTKVNWPDFDKNELEKAIEEYGRRERRYGGV